MKKQSSIHNKIELNRDQRRRAQKPSQTVCHLAHSESKASTISCSTAHRPRRLGCLHPTAGHPDDGEACYFWVLLPRHEGCQKSPQCYNERLGTRSRPLDRGIVRSLCSHIQLLDQQQARGISWTDVLQVVAFVGLVLLAVIDVKLIK